MKKPIKVRIRNNSAEQRLPLETFVVDLIRNGIVHFNPTSPWSSAPLLVPKPRPTKFRFTVELRSVKKSLFIICFPCQISRKNSRRFPSLEFFPHFICRTDTGSSLWIWIPRSASRSSHRNAFPPLHVLFTVRRTRSPMYNRPYLRLYRTTYGRTYCTGCIIS